MDLADDKTLIDLDSLDKINERHGDNKDNLTPWQAGHTLSLRNRNLRGAMFDRADLRNVDLFVARIQGALLSEAWLWRVYGGPDRIHLEDVWIEAPQLTPLLKEDLARLEERSLEGVTSEVVKKRIRGRLERLSKENDWNELPESFWTDLAGSMSRFGYPKYSADRAERLEQQICNDEGSTLYVAQGLIKYRLEYIGDRRRVARKLFDAAEGSTSVCPGLKELDDESISTLREWAKKKENKG